MKKKLLRLLCGCMALVLCGSLAVNGTHAFSAVSRVLGANTVSTAELDFEVLWSEDMTNWQEVEDATTVFTGGQWEPGYTQVRYIKIENTGGLEFRYQLQLVPVNAPGPLAEVIRVYSADAPDAPYTDRRALIDPANYSGKLQAVGGVDLLQGALLTGKQSAPGFRSGEVVYAIALQMDPAAGNTYQNKTTDDYTVLVNATQFDYDGVLTVEQETPVFDNATLLLPESAIASSAEVVDNTAPYAYTDTSLFAGRTITRIGIPVKSVAAPDENQTFTLSVVRTTPSTGTATVAAANDTYEYVEGKQYKLKLPADQLGDSTTVNRWVYVDLSQLNIQLGMDETLAFGAPDDTVNWGYLKTNNNPYNFRRCDTSWSSVINESIVFDVYTDSDLVFKATEETMVATIEGPVLGNVQKILPNEALADSNSVEPDTAPFAYTDTTLFAGKKITRIGIPVQSVAALDENQTFTLSVVKTAAGSYQTVKTIPLTLPRDQLGDSTAVNRWVYVDLSGLNLQLGEDETLAFGGLNDDVTWGWKKNYSDKTYQFRNKNGSISTGIFFDVTAVEELTYEQYVDELKLQNLLRGKKVSILGDSISTFAGYSNNTNYNSTIGGNAVYYNGSKDGFASVEETWWLQTIRRTGAQLLVNNSWSGDTVTGRGVARAAELDTNADAAPDLIAVYLGINDFRTKVSVSDFAVAYEQMIKTMKEKYPKADIFLFTLVYTTDVYNGVNPADVVNFNKVIEQLAVKYGLPVVDLYNDSGITPDTMAANMGDGKLHPNYAGMDRITECFLDALMAKYLPAAG